MSFDKLQNQSYLLNLYIDEDLNSVYNNSFSIKNHYRDLEKTEPIIHFKAKLSIPVLKVKNG